jgi:hypothetical protein
LRYAIAWWPPPTLWWQPPEANGLQDADVGWKASVANPDDGMFLSDGGDDGEGVVHPLNDVVEVPPVGVELIPGLLPLPRCRCSSSETDECSVEG